MCVCVRIESKALRVCRVALRVCRVALRVCRVCVCAYRIKPVRKVATRPTGPRRPSTRNSRGQRV